MTPFRYVPAHLLEGRPHVMVDGAARHGTVFTLSHWPRTPTPSSLRGDLSAELVRDALRYPRSLPPSPGVASLDHYDVDGVVALALAVVDGLDAEQGSLLVEAARVGDFDVVTDHRAALIAFALQALAPTVGAGGSEGAGGADPLERSDAATAEALEGIASLATDPDRFASLWQGEWSAYRASVAALADRRATIEEFPEQDLAVVRVDGAEPGETAWAGAPLHRAAVHSATSRLRVATVFEGGMELRYRYESWVRLTSRRPRLRVDLGKLAEELSAEERDGARWVFDGAGALIGALHLVGDTPSSTVGERRFLAMVRAHLAAADVGPPAWDPYRSD